MSSKPEYSIYPAIGVARVGNSPTAWYVGPEEYRGLPILPNGEDRPFEPKDFRGRSAADKDDGIARQAARFKIYRTPETGPAEEITLETPGVRSITWTVHLANKKSSWYEFKTLDGEDGYPPNHPLRNAGITDPAERQRRLIVDAGPRSVNGAGARADFTPDTAPAGYPASFPPTGLKPAGNDIVTLGELRTDAAGRLLVLGGHGHSGTLDEKPDLAAYANNDGWWDDTSDGPVTARIEFANGPAVEVEAAWVLVGPPGYAPQIPNLVTLYDTLYDTAVRNQGANRKMFENGLWEKGVKGYHPHYETEIEPIFKRGELYRWVAAIPPRPHEFQYGMMGDPNPAFNAYRAYFVEALRPPGDENILVNKRGVTMMPYLAGDDALNAEAPGSVTAATDKYLRLTDTQYYLLEQWANGHFVVGPAAPEHPGEALTRAVLENCVGGAFSPGIEMSWISRNPAIYARPFRIRVRKAVPAPLSLGFDPAAGMEPGDITRYMAMPWQADFNECSSQTIVGRVLWWWPAQRPEYVHVPEKSGETRQVAWVGTDFDQNADSYISFVTNVEMVEKWAELGFVYGQPGAHGGEPKRYLLVDSRLAPTPGGGDATKPAE